MKTTTQSNKTKKWLTALLIGVGMFSLNALWACSVTISTSYGLNGHVTFHATATDTDRYGNQFVWNPGDGSGNMWGDSILTHTYTANGTYTVAVQLTVDSESCYAVDTVSINVTNITVPCTLSASFSYIIGAHGAVTFTSTSTGTYSKTQYYWNAGDGSSTVLGTSTYNHTYSYQGLYYVWLYVRDTGSAYCNDSIQEAINVTTADSNSCHLVANFMDTLGVNGHVFFNNTSTTITSYNTVIHWNFGDGFTATTSNNRYNYIYGANGTYNVTMYITIGDSSAMDTLYCHDSITKSVTITNITIPCALSAGFNVVNDTTIGQVQFIGTSTGTNSGTEYFWKPTSSSVAIKGGSSYTTTYSANGTYDAWLIIKDTGSAFCEDSIMEEVNVSNVDSLHASFINTGSSDTLGNYDYFFQSTSTGVNGVTMYAWEPGDSTAGDTGLNMTTYNHYYKYPGTHTVTLSVWFFKYPIIAHNGGEGNFKKQTYYQLSTYKLKVDVGAPQGIATINGNTTDFKLYPNPSNGQFKLAVSGMESNVNADIQITNVLGEVIYQTTASTNNGTTLKDINLNAPYGTYFVRVITPNRVYNTKLVINK